MSAIKVIFEVADLTHLLLTYDQVKVYRSTTGVDGTFSEVSDATTRVDLVAGTTVYEFVDHAGDPAYLYKIAYYNAVGPVESDLSEVVPLLLLDIDAVRAEGITVAKASDARVLMLIRTWQAFVERATGNWFIPRTMTLDFDGRGTTLLQLPYPIVSITSVYANEDFTIALDSDEYKVYAGRGLDERDDRRNPRIKLVTTEESIFSGTGAVRGRNTVFEVGEQNQRVVGVFGYVEPDGSAPSPIVYALLRLVVAGAQSKLGASSGSVSGPVVEEETDRHRRRYADVFVGSKMWPTTGDSVVDQILARYRRPISTRGPRTLHRRGFRSGIL